MAGIWRHLLLKLAPKVAPFARGINCTAGSFRKIQTRDALALTPTGVIRLEWPFGPGCAVSLKRSNCGKSMVLRVSQQDPVSWGWQAHL